MNIKTKLSSLMYPPIALALLAACSSNDVLENNNETTTQGQTLTIRATTGGEDGTRVSFDQTTYATKWETNDKVYIYAGDTKKVGEFTVSNITNDHNAVLKGTISGTLSATATTNITGYIYNSKVETSDSGSPAAVTNYGKHIDVDYSEQKGTWEDAMSRCVLFGQGTYNPNNTDQTVDMKFEYKTTFFKLMLDFGDTSINTTATMCLTGDNMVSNSRINAIGANAGEQEYAKDLFINIKDVAITNGKATVYVAMYSQPLKNVYLQAVLKNGADGADGDVYDFNISNNATTAITLEPGKVYPIERTGVKQETSSTWEGKGTQTNPFLIKSAADLKLLAYNVKNKLAEGVEDPDNRNAGYNGRYFKLASDIIINGEWEPIGNNGYPFRGKFDGYNHTISGNITITNLPTKTGSGLFGYAGVNCEIRNIISKLNLKVTTTATDNYAGILVGRIVDKVTIENCVNLGSIESGTTAVGGFVGSPYLSNQTNNYECIIEGCCNKGNVYSTRTLSATTSVGGIVGLVNGGKDRKPNIKIIGCYTTGVTFTSPKTNGVYTGGIIGNIANARDAAQTEVKACWTSDLTFPGSGGRAYLVASPSSIPFTLSKCWYEITDTKIKPINSTEATTECKSSTDTELSGYISEMNTAWASDTYKFNSDGTIKTK